MANNNKYTEAQLVKSRDASTAFESIIATMKDGVKVTLGEVREARSGKNTYVVATAEGRDGKVWLSVKYVHDFLGAVVTKEGDGYIIPEGLTCVVSSGRLAVAQA